MRLVSSGHKRRYALECTRDTRKVNKFQGKITFFTKARTQLELGNLGIQVKRVTISIAGYSKWALFLAFFDGWCVCPDSRLAFSPNCGF